jgi:DNA repair protein RAD16
MEKTSKKAAKAAAIAAAAAAVPSYLVELAKSGRADCKRCDAKIENKSIRVGTIIEGEWGLFTRWQHLHCMVFHKELASAELIDGYRTMSIEDQKRIQDRFEASKNEIDEDDIPIEPDELVRKAWDKPTEPSASLLMPLLPYQKEGLGWMVHQEHCETHGGILADEMGMGKLRNT